MGAIPKAKYSVQEYLDLDRKAERKGEYHDGEIFPILDATVAHSRIAANLGLVFIPRLRGTGCQSQQSPLRVGVSATQFVYPDFLVVCGEPNLTDEQQDTLTNPKVIVEILSPSTADYDHGGKFALYRSLPTFEEYVLIAQDKPMAEIFRRQSPDDWSLQIVTNPQAVVQLRSIGIEFPLREIYEGVGL